MCTNSVCVQVHSKSVMLLCFTVGNNCLQTADGSIIYTLKKKYQKDFRINITSSYPLLIKEEDKLKGK